MRMIWKLRLISPEIVKKMSKWIVFCLNGVVVENVICYDFVTRHNEN